MRSFDVFFHLFLKKRLSKQSRRRWFETISRSLWRHCNEYALLPILTEKSSWKNQHCDMEAAFVCKAPRGAGEAKTVPPTPSTAGFCPPGYFDGLSRGKIEIAVEKSASLCCHWKRYIEERVRLWSWYHRHYLHHNLNYFQLESLLLTWFNFNPNMDN